MEIFVLEIDLSPMLNQVDTNIKFFSFLSKILKTKLKLQKKKKNEVKHNLTRVGIPNPHSLIFTPRIELIHTRW